MMLIPVLMSRASGAGWKSAIEGAPPGSVVTLEPGVYRAEVCDITLNPGEIPFGLSLTCKFDRN